MKEVHNSNDGLITMSLTKRDDVENWGVATLVENKITGFVEKPSSDKAPSNLINAGAFIVHPTALDVLPEGKSSIERECFSVMADQGKVFAQFHKGYWFPTDNLEKYEFANEQLRSLT